MQKILGKIRYAEFGTVRDYPWLFGLELFFDLSDGTTIGTGGTYMVNIDPECRWEPQERKDAIEKMVYHLHKTLEDAQVNHVSELIKKPVEVTIDKNTFHDFRILTEVL